MANEAAKKAAARAAAQLVENDMTVGLGTGSTAARFIEALAERVEREGLTIRGVPTSRAGEALAVRLAIPVVALSASTRPDLTVDGADEADARLNLIKGGGGALVREKLVASASKRFVVIADESKAVETLGAFPLPVAVVPFGWETTQARVAGVLGRAVSLALRRDATGAPFVSDDGLFVLDARCGAIPDPAFVERLLQQVVGVVEVGLFTAMAERVLFGRADGSTFERFATPSGFYSESQ